MSPERSFHKEDSASPLWAPAGSGPALSPFVITVFVALASAIILSPLLSTTFSFDQCVFSAIAKKLLQGGITYKDAWEHKPPGIFYVYYWTFLLIAPEIWAVRLVELLALSLSSAGLYLLVRKRTGSSLGGMVSGLMLATIYLKFLSNSAQPESFQIPCLIGALLVWPDRTETRHVGRRCFLAGCISSIGILFKTPHVAFPLYLIGERLCWDWRREENLRKIRFSVLTAGGVCLPIALLFVYYALRGAGPEIYDAFFVFPAQYASWGYRGMPLWFQLSGVIGWTTTLLSPLAIAFCLIGALRVIELRTDEAWRWFGVLVSSLAMVMMQGKYFQYHFIPITPALAWGMGLCFVQSPFPAPEDNARRRAMIILARSLEVAGATCCILYGVWQGRDVYRFPVPVAYFANIGLDQEDRDNWMQQVECSDQLRMFTKEKDRIFVFGDKPLLYILSDREMAGANCHLMQVAPPWDDGRRMSSLLQRLSREKPRIVVIAPGKMWWRNLQEPAQVLEKTPQFVEYLHSEFTPRKGPPGYTLWIRN